jgi:hypothetical protein
MKKALISTEELIAHGYRVAQVENVENIFPVAETMFWIDCLDDTIPDKYFYNPATTKIEKIEIQE